MHDRRVTQSSEGRSFRAGVAAGASLKTGSAPAPDPLPDETGTGGTGLVIVLLLVTCLHPLGGVSMVPVLSALRVDYADNRHADVLVPMAMSVYALATALFSPIAGLIADRFGRRALLLCGLVAYAALGTAPLWITSLEQLVLSRMLLGAAGAAVFIGSLTMLGDLRQGARFAIVVGAMSLVDNLTATALYPLVGALGNSSWRYTSWPYASALGMALLLAVVLVRQGPALPADTGLIHSHRRGTMRWGRLVPAALLTLFGTFIFYAPTVASVTVLERADMTSPGTLGLISGVTIGATAIGAGIFIEVARARLAVTLTVALTIAALGFLIMAGSGVPDNRTVDGVVAIVGLIFAGLGCGLLLPAMNTWCTRDLTYRNRGRAVGVFFGSFYLGVFLVPIAIQVLAPRIGGILTFFGVLSGLSFVVGLCTAAAALRSSREQWPVDGLAVPGSTAAPGTMRDTRMPPSPRHFDDTGRRP